MFIKMRHATLLFLLVIQFSSAAFSAEFVCADLFRNLTLAQFNYSGRAQVDRILDESKSPQSGVSTAIPKYKTIVPPKAFERILELIKKSGGDVLLLEEVDLNSKPPWALQLKRETFVDHISKVLDLLSDDPETYRGVLENDEIAAIYRIQVGLRETLKASLTGNLSAEKRLAFADQVNKYLYSKSNSQWELKTILTQLRQLKFNDDHWILMLSYFYKVARLELESNPNRAEILELLESTIRQSFTGKTEFSENLLAEYFSIAVTHRILFVPLVQSKVHIPARLRPMLHNALMVVEFDIKRDPAAIAVGYLISKELFRRNIIPKSAAQVVQTVLESSDLNISPETRKLFQDLKDSNIRHFKTKE